MNRWLAAAWVTVLGVALAWRVPHLALRPFHNDEAVNAVKFQKLYVNNNYKYDPVEFHGPTLPYLTLPAAWIDGGGEFNGFTEALFRAVPVAFGLALVLLPLLLARDLGKPATLLAGAFTALSPAMVFYSRYYIHEMLLVFFTGLAFAGFWRWRQSGRAAWAVVGGWRSD